MDAKRILLIIALSFSAAPSYAGVIEISQFSLFANTGSGSAQDDQLGVYDPIFAPQINSFGDLGLDVSFSSGLGSDNTGLVTWSVTNNSGSDIASASLTAFLDADLGGNVFWNESGDTFGDLSASYYHWEVDEPGYLFGDIYDNVVAGSLDNTNALPSGMEEDVSLALGFSIDNWLAGMTIETTWYIGSALPDQYSAGLMQTDFDTQDTMFFAGSMERVIASVDEPQTLYLSLLGLAALFLRKRRSP